MLSAMQVPSRLLIPIAALLLFGASGCATDTVRAPAPTPGVARSPAEAVRWLEWAWSQRDTAALRELLTDDFEFVFDLTDTLRVPDWGRSQDLVSSRHLFVGGGAQAPARRIALEFDRTLIALSDPRPGRNPIWHKVIRTGMVLGVVDTTGSEWDLSGYVRFFLVRGDSAATMRSGSGPDPNRWWIERLEDETSGGAARLLPGDAPTWGRLKRLYLD